MVDATNWPPGPRRIGAIARFLAYAMACIVGIDVILNQTTRAGGHAGVTTISAIGAIVALGGAFAAAGVINRRWRMEFVAIAAIGGALAVYGLIDWMIVLFIRPEMPVRGPAIVSAVFWLLVYRGAGLYVFSRTATRAKRLRRSSGSER